jgi:hypothetical protein
MKTKQRSIAVLALMAWVTTFAAGCYYDRDDRWGYHRYPERRYSYRYYRYDRYGDWRYDRDYDRRYSRNDPDPLRYHYND